MINQTIKHDGSFELCCNKEDERYFDKVCLQHGIKRPYLEIR